MFKFTQEILGKTLSAQEFMEFTSSIFERKSKEKPYDNENYLNYTKSNFRWSKRMAKSFEITPQQQEILQNIEKPMLWILLNEPWCGDGAFTQALLNQIAIASEGKITLQILLRDKNPEVINNFLTNGGMAIPKLIVLDKNYQLITTWGPRPKKLQDQLEGWKKDENFDNTAKIHRVYEWYIKDKNQSAQEEIFELISKEIE